MAIVVRPRMSSVNAAWISASISLSTALVASSRIRSAGSAAMARANDEQLPLADADRRATLAQPILVPARQTVDHTIGADACRGPLDFGVGQRRWTTECCRPRRRRRERCPAARSRSANAAPPSGMLPDVDAIERNPPTLRIVESHEQTDDRRLARARMADDARRSRPGDARKAHALEHPLRWLTPPPRSPSARQCATSYANHTSSNDDRHAAHDAAGVGAAPRRRPRGGDAVIAALRRSAVAWAVRHQSGLPGLVQQPENRAPTTPWPAAECCTCPRGPAAAGKTGAPAAETRPPCRP